MILRTVTWLTFTPRSARSAEIAEHAPAHGFLRGCVAVGGREPVVRVNLPSSAALMGNVAALVVFRVGHEDALVLAPEFDRPHQAFNPYALRQLPRGEAMVRISSQEGELVEMHPDPASCGSAERVKQQSRIHYSKRRGGETPTALTSL